MVDSGASAASSLSSVHTHSRFCDGHGEIEEYVVAAIDRGLAVFGASGHAPLPFPCEYAIGLTTLDAYRAEVRRLQAKYRERIPVLLGLELDYLPGLGDFYNHELFSRGLDYVVASVHYIGEPGDTTWVYDESDARFAAEIERRHAGNARLAVEDYFRRVGAMVEESAGWNLPIVVGHLDRIVLWNRDNRYFSTESEWFQEAVGAALATIAASNCVLELNTSGWNKPAALSNPSLTILRRAADAGIRIIISADAHWPENVAQHFDRAVRLLREAGYESLVVPSPEGWHDCLLPG